MEEVSPPKRRGCAVLEAEKDGNDHKKLVAPAGLHYRMSLPSCTAAVEALPVDSHSLKVAVAHDARTEHGAEGHVDESENPARELSPLPLHQQPSPMNPLTGTPGP